MNYDECDILFLSFESNVRVCLVRFVHSSSVRNQNALHHITTSTMSSGLRPEDEKDGALPPPAIFDEGFG